MLFGLLCVNCYLVILCLFVWPTCFVVAGLFDFVCDYSVFTLGGLDGLFVIFLLCCYVNCVS